LSPAFGPTKTASGSAHNSDSEPVAAGGDGDLAVVVVDSRQIY
jgi:hypothetical protein